jgi:hypothetical protein
MRLLEFHGAGAILRQEAEVRREFVNGNAFSRVADDGGISQSERRKLLIMKAMQYLQLLPQRNIFWS